MQVTRLHIQSTHGNIGLQSQRPHLEIEQKAPDLFISQEHHVLDITHTQASLTIDQTAAFDSANLKHIFNLNKEYAAKALNKAVQATMRYAAEGNQLMRIENGGNVIAHLAKKNAVIFNEKQVTIKQMPSPFSVKTHYKPREVKVNVNATPVNIQVQRKEPNVKVPHWNTEVY
ncbi:MAG: DUF6470 family protein [Bacillaceae bacterium]|nr:DUF6470 family protein [Bacillaceae bacterium]